LGAGKTTVLEQLLRDKHGFKLGVIVNDLASVNVDANVLRDAIEKSGTQSMSLENGCVCCTASDDLQKSVQNMLRDADAQKLDAIVVELSGVAEPARAKQVLQAPRESASPEKNTPVSVRTVTVVDTPAFATDYLSEQTAHQHHTHTASGECDDRYGTLLAEQVEGADLLLLNKADVTSEEELTQTRAMVKVLNEMAAIRVTEYGQIEVDEFLDVKPRSRKDRQVADKSCEVEDVVASPEVQQSAAPVSACCATKTCSSTNTESTKDCESKSSSGKTPSRAESRFGITSFVYSTERIMSRAKLLKRLSEWQQSRADLGNKLDLQGLSHEHPQASSYEAQNDTSCALSSPLAPILRSKGVVLLDANPDVAFYWSHAGKSISFSVFGPWPESTAQAQGGFGPRRTELVFIGAGYNETSIRELLDSCLFTDADWEFFNRMRGSEPKAP
jgi:G3E family GTPase